MKFESSASEPRKIEDLPKKGARVARCYSVVDLGTQEVEFEGLKKLQRKMQITWEIPSDMRVFKEGEEKQPIVIGKKYTQSTHEKATIMKDLESWFADDNRIEGDVVKLIQTKLVGRPAMLTVTHSSYEKGGKTYPYASVAGVSSLPEEMTCPEQINPSVFFDLDNFNKEVFESLPEWVQGVIKQSPEYKEVMGSEKDGSGVVIEKDLLPF